MAGRDALLPHPPSSLLQAAVSDFSGPSEDPMRRYAIDEHWTRSGEEGWVFRATDLATNRTVAIKGWFGANGLPISRGDAHRSLTRYVDNLGQKLRWECDVARRIAALISTDKAKSGLGLMRCLQDRVLPSKASEFRSPAAIILEYGGDVSLDVWITQRLQAGTLHPRDLESIWAQLKSALGYLSAAEASKFVHREVTPENIVVRQGQVDAYGAPNKPLIMLIDFGSVVQLDVGAKGDVERVHAGGASSAAKLDNYWVGACKTPPKYAPPECRMQAHEGKACECRHKAPWWSYDAFSAASVFTAMFAGQDAPWLKLILDKTRDGRFQAQDKVDAKELFSLVRHGAQARAAKLGQTAVATMDAVLQQWSLKVAPSKSIWKSIARSLGSVQSKRSKPPKVLFSS